MHRKSRVEIVWRRGGEEKEKKREFLYEKKRKLNKIKSFEAIRANLQWNNNIISQVRVKYRGVEIFLLFFLTNCLFTH